MNDLRFAMRQIRKSPGFTSLAVLTLAIGIGMNTAIFSLMQDLFLRGLPFSEPERVVRIYGESKGARFETDAVLRAEVLALPRRTNGFLEYRGGLGQRLHHDRIGRADSVTRRQCNCQLFRIAWHPSDSRSQFSPGRREQRRRRDRDGEFLAQAFQLRSDDSRPQHYTERCADHNHRRAPESADFVVRTRLGDFCQQTIRAARAYEGSLDARSQLHARDGAVETGRFAFTSAGGDARHYFKVTKSNIRKRPTIPGRRTWSQRRKMSPEICVQLS